MDSSTDDATSWDIGTISTSQSDDVPSQPSLDPRSYQIEMYEHSMRENIIATMATGSGKTMVARLRIEAALQNCPTKRVWFMTPNVVLAEQQHAFLVAQLPSYSFRLITGADNVQFWGSQQVWDAALRAQHGIVSTPEVLRAALNHAFVSLDAISLLVIDEAHHGMKKHPINLIMQDSYHPLRFRSSDPAAIPAVLGLTASPIMQSQIEAMKELESNLNAVCSAPTLNLEEYQRFVHIPQMHQLLFSGNFAIPSVHLATLNAIIATYDLPSDPTYLRLKGDESLTGMQKFNKILNTQKTPVLEQLRRLQNQATHLHTQLGTWASDRYIGACVSKLDDLLVGHGLFTIGEQENLHLHRTLTSLRTAKSNQDIQKPEHINTSDKARTLASFLVGNFTEQTQCIIFVTRRATAWALNALLNALPSVQMYKSFALVGGNAVERGLADLVESGTQQKSLAGFRQGTLNLCVATSVLEEGIDVQACNAVVCFDDSDNVKSFIQRRGRARRADSKYVFMQDSADSSTRYIEYQAIEAAMKQAYEEQDRQVAEIMSKGDTDEECDWKYTVASTGAVLPILQARAHLHHFCNKLPRREGRGVPEPVFIVQGTPGLKVSCRLILPSSVPTHLQVTESQSLWLNEKNAKNEAAFLACVALHRNGLLNDNLLPPARDKEDTTLEGRDSFYLVKAAVDPWHQTRGSMTSAHLYAHRIALNGDEYASLLLLLPSSLKHCQDVYLHVSASMVEASITSVGEQYDVDVAIAIQATKLLFNATLQRRLPNLSHAEYKLPYYLVPDILPSELSSWIQESRTISPLTKFDFSQSARSTFLIRAKGETVPYFYTPSTSSEVRGLSRTQAEIEATRLSRHMNFLSETRFPILRRSLPVDQCGVVGLDPCYVKSIALIPSIMHTVEISLRAQSACSGPLAQIRFKDQKLVAAALTAPGAGQHDYQRLEFIGDSMLKYLSCVNLFCLNQDLPESHLNLLKDRVVSNARLQRATRELGLDTFLSTRNFSSQDWTLAEKAEPASPRMLASKILADVVEALIGAAYMDVESDGEPHDLSKVLECLKVFLPEILWQPPASAVSRLKQAFSSKGGDQIRSVEILIGYTFNNNGLLQEALTHSTVQVGVQSYERLEFLGDAIIDLIVKDKLWSSPLALTEGQMTERSSSLVNKDILAYFSTKLATEKEMNDVFVDPRMKKAVVTERMKRVCLHDYMSRLPNREMMEQRAHFLERFESVKDILDEGLREGKAFPWIELYHLASPKWCSDVLESIIGAVYVDSGASLSVCEGVLTTIGLMEFVKRAAVENDVVYAQPLRVLREGVPELKVETRRREVKTRKDEEEATLIVSDCRLMIGEQVVGMWTGASCQAEAESRAAEITLKKIENGEIELSGALMERVAARRKGIAKGKQTEPQEEGDESETEMEVQRAGRHMNEQDDEGDDGIIDGKQRSASQTGEEDDVVTFSGRHLKRKRAATESRRVDVGIKDHSQG